MLIAMATHSSQKEPYSGFICREVADFLLLQEEHLNPDVESDR